MSVIKGDFDDLSQKHPEMQPIAERTVTIGDHTYTQVLSLKKGAHGIADKADARELLQNGGVLAEVFNKLGSDTSLASQTESLTDRYVVVTLDPERTLISNTPLLGSSEPVPLKLELGDLNEELFDACLKQLNDQKNDARYGPAHFESAPMQTLLQILSTEKLSDDDFSSLRLDLLQWGEDLLPAMEAEFAEVQSLIQESKKQGLPVRSLCEIRARVALFQSEMQALAGLLDELEAVHSENLESLKPLIEPTLGRAREMSKELDASAQMRVPKQENVERLLKKEWSRLQESELSYPALSARLGALLEAMGDATDSPIPEIKGFLSERLHQWQTDTIAVDALRSELDHAYHDLGELISAESSPSAVMALLTGIIKCESNVESLRTKYSDPSCPFPELSEWHEGRKEEVAATFGVHLRRVQKALHKAVDHWISEYDALDGKSLSVPEQVNILLALSNLGKWTGELQLFIDNSSWESLPTAFAAVRTAVKAESDPFGLPKLAEKIGIDIENEVKTLGNEFNDEEALIQGLEAAKLAESPLEMEKALALHNFMSTHGSNLSDAIHTQLDLAEKFQEQQMPTGVAPQAPPKLVPYQINNQEADAYGSHARNASQRTTTPLSRRMKNYTKQVERERKSLEGMSPGWKTFWNTLFVGIQVSSAALDVIHRTSAPKVKKSTGLTVVSPEAAAAQRRIKQVSQETSWGEWFRAPMQTAKKVWQNSVARGVYEAQLQGEIEATAVENYVAAIEEYGQGWATGFEEGGNQSWAVNDIFSGWQSGVLDLAVRLRSLSKATDRVIAGQSPEAFTNQLGPESLGRDDLLMGLLEEAHGVNRIVQYFSGQYWAFGSEFEKARSDLIVPVPEWSPKLPGSDAPQLMLPAPEFAEELKSYDVTVETMAAISQQIDLETSISSMPPIAMDNLPMQAMTETPAPDIKPPSVPLNSVVDEAMLPPKVAEEIQAKQNAQLIVDAFAEPGSVPSDKTYYHVISSFVPDLDAAFIEGQKLAGMPVLGALGYVLETQKAYLESLLQSPETMTACRRDACEAVLGVTGLDAESAADPAILRSTIQKMEQAIDLRRTLDEGKMGSFDARLQGLLANLDPGETLFFPLSWGSTNGRHATMLEIEMQEDGQVMMRLFNTGEGLRYHASADVGQEEMYLPFHERVNIDPKRLCGGAFGRALAALGRPDIDSMGKGWNADDFYEVVASAVGGELSTRILSPEYLRPAPSVRTCSMGSVLVMMDKSMVSENLAERMRFLTLARSTKNYYEGNKSGLISGTNAEARRRLLLRGIKATLEQAERALESQGLVGDELKPVLNELRDIEKVLLRLHRADVGSIAKQAIDLTERNVWQATGKLPENLETVAFESAADREHSAITRPAGADLTVDLGTVEPQNLLGSLTMLTKKASAGDTSATDARWLVKEGLGQLPVSEDFWSKLPTDLAKEVLAEVSKLQELHFLQLATQMRKDKESSLTSHDLLGVLKTHTVIDTLTSVHPEALGANLPAFHHPWMLGLLDIDGGAATDAVGLVGKGSWRSDLLAMREYWKARLPETGPSIDSTDPFSFDAHPAGIHRVRTIQRKGIGAAEDTDLLAMQGWIAANSETMSRVFPELVRETRLDQAVKILGAKDTKGNPYCERLPGLAAGIRSALIIDLIRTSDPARVPVLESLSGTGYSAKENRDSWALTRSLGGTIPEWSMGGEDGTACWKINDRHMPLPNKDFESLVHESRDVRGPRRRMVPNKAGTATPLDVDGMFNLGVQEVRELLALSSIEELQVTDDAALFGHRLGDLLDENRIQMVLELINEPGVLEKNIALDPSLSKGLAKFCASGVTLGNLIDDPYTSGLFAYLSRSLAHQLAEIGQRLSLEIDTSAFPQGPSLFTQLLERTDPVEMPDAVKEIHYFRAKSFEGLTSLTAEQVGEFAASYHHLSNAGMPKKMEGSARYSLDEIHEMFHVQFRKELQRHLEDPSSSNTVLNLIAGNTSDGLEETEWKAYESYPLFISVDGEMRYDASTGALDRDILGTVPTPAILASDPMFQSLFGSDVDVLDQIAPDTYTYRGHRLFVQNGQPIIQQEFESKWHQAFNPQEILSSLPFAKTEDLRSAKGGIAWLPVGQELASIDSIPFTDANGASIFTLRRVASDSFFSSETWQAVGLNNRSLCSSDASSLTEVLGRVEDPKYVYIYSDQTGLSDMHLPRYNLKLQRREDSVSGGFYLASSDLDGFGLRSGGQQYVEVLGDFHEYLPLSRPGSNGLYEQGVLIPALPLAPQKHEGLTTPTKLTLARESWDESVDSYLFRLEEDTLVPIASSTKEVVLANAQVATIFLSERKYEVAAKYLTALDRALKSTKDLSSAEEMEAIRLIATFEEVNDDYSPQAAAVRLRARAILQRQSRLKKATAVRESPESLKEDFQNYNLHLGRIPASLRLSDEHFRILFGFRAPPVPLRAKRDKSGLSELMEEQLIVTPGRRLTSEAPRYTFHMEPLPLSNALFSSEPIFVKAFPEEILPLYALLQDPTDIRSSAARRVAHLLGIDDKLKRPELKEAATTFVELRYRYLIHRMKMVDSGEAELRTFERQNLDAEIHLLAVLVNASRGDGTPAEEVEDSTQNHQDLLAMYRKSPEYRQHVKVLQDLLNELEGDILDEAVTIWRNWVAVEALPIPLSPARAAEMEYPPIGPHALDRMPLPKAATFTAEELRSIELPMNLEQPAYLLVASPVCSPGDFDELFSSVSSPREVPVSPYQVTSRDPVIGEVFSQYNKLYNEFADGLGDLEYTYTLSNGQALETLGLDLASRAESARIRAESKEEQLLTMLNRLPEDPSLRSHAEVRIMRGVQKRLTLSDAKAALARKWDAEHILTLNPALTREEVQTIFETTLAAMLERREEQRLARSVRALDRVRYAENTSSAEYQALVQDLKEALDEHLEYDPYEDPVFLVIETEFDIGLWSAQVPAMRQLAPSEQVTALVELAMGLGKTDVISPAVLCILADGKTLPIVVMPEALVPSMAARLQERMGQGFDREIRVIPIDRVERSAEEIDHLRTELETMVAQRVPLVWSSTDIQTLINSYVEDRERIRTGALGPEEGRAVNLAWQKFFTTLRDSAQILGDEIHAILDILTSYNFTLGEPKKLTEDEMDAVEDFLQIVIQHPEISKTSELPFIKGSKGTPLTEEHFNEVVAKQIIGSIMERGVTNDERARDFVNNLSSEEKAQIRGYLESDHRVSKEEIDAIQLPVASEELLERVGTAKMPYDSREWQNLLEALLPEDREKIQWMMKSRQFAVPVAVREMFAEYSRLNKRLHNFLAVQKEAIRIIFSLTAGAQVGKHYAANRDRDGAIPADEGTPQWDSLFGSSLERLFYTSFLFMQEGVAREVVEEDLLRFVRGLREEVASGDIDQPSESKWIAAFQERYGTEFQLSTAGFARKMVGKILDYVNENPSRQMALIRQHYLPKTEVYDAEIESTTHMFPMITRRNKGREAEGSLSGMAGTLFNKATFPNVFGESHLSNTIHLVTERVKRVSPSETAATVEWGNNIEDNLMGLYVKSEIGPGCVIDTTGYLNKAETREYAALMLSVAALANPKIKGVVFYEGDDLLVLISDREEPVLYDKRMDPDSLLALWEVSHTTGSDIRLGSTSHATMLVGKHLRLFEMAQAAMRLRRLGRGQRLELAIPKGDKVIMAGKLRDHLGLEIGEDDDLTIDQVIQYALLNELLQETENNYRAVDMRMRMALMDPIVELLWNPDTPAEKAAEIYELCAPLFIKRQAEQPYEQYGDPIFKIDVEVGMERKLESWKNHPVLKAIKEHPALFPNVDVEELHKQFEEIMAGDLGPIQQEVDATSYVGSRQRTEAKVQQKTKEKIKLRERTKQKLEVRKREVRYGKRGMVAELRRDAYPERPPIPSPSNPFTREAQAPMMLEDVLTAKYSELSAEAQGSLHGSGIQAVEVLELDKVLHDGLDFRDRDIQFSLNLAPVWQAPNAAPVYTPYDYFQKFPSHALVIQDKETGKVRLKLIDKNDFKELAAKLEEDRKHPERAKENAVNLGIYHLESDRLLVEGSETIDFTRNPGATSRFNEMVAKAKLLSGITHFTDDQALILDGWLEDRDPEVFFKAYATRLARNLDRTMETFSKSVLGKMLIERGLSEERQAEFLGSTPFVVFEKTHQLLYDRSLSGDDRVELASDIHAYMEQAEPGSLSDWSDLVSPLLPLMFEMRGFNGATERPDHAPAPNASDTLVRLWLMRAFYPSIADEYGAWKTALPSISFTKNQLGLYESLGFTSNVGALEDPDAEHLLIGLEMEPSSEGKKRAELAQMEIMADLAHPIWGLPMLANSQSVEHLRSGALDQAGKGSRVGSLLDQVSAAPTWGAYTSIAVKMALAAIERVDIPYSLAAISAKDSDYPFEYLHGLFAFLAAQGEGGSDRSEYGLYMLERLYADKLGDEIVYYSKYIPEQLTVATEQLQPGQIKRVLSRSLEAATQAFPAPRDLLRREESLDAWRTPEFWELSTAIRGFTYDATAEVAKTSSEWLNEELASSRTFNWFKAGAVYQIFRRSEALVDHSSLGNYMMRALSPSQRSSMLEDLLKFASVKGYSSDDIVALDRWRITDFDLLVELTDLNTLERPDLSTAEVAGRFADELGKLPSTHCFAPEERALFTRSIRNMVNKFELPFNEFTKKEVGRLVDVADRISAEADWEDFKRLQETVAPLRLAARHPGDATARQEDALVELEKLFSNQRNGSDAVVHTLFITNHLMTQPKQVPVEDVQRILDLMQHAAETKSRQNKGRDKSTWTKSPDWWDLIEVTAPITFQGTKAQAAVAFDWLNSALSEHPATNWMIDGMTMQLMKYNPGSVKHEDLADYADRRTPERNYSSEDFLRDLVDRAGISRWRGSGSAPALVALTARNFDLFGDLGDLKTQGRKPLSAEKLARDMDGLFREPIYDAPEKLLDEPLLSFGLKNLNSRARSSALRHEVRNAVSEMIGGAEGAISRSEGPLEKRELIGELNQARMVSDFSEDPAAIEKNLLRAVDELLGSGATELRKRLYLDFIPDSLLSMAGSNTAWTAAVINKSIDVVSGEHLAVRGGALQPSQRELVSLMVDKIASQGDPKVLGQMVDNAIQIEKPSWLLDEYVLKVIGTNPSSLDHASLMKYIGSRRDFAVRILRHVGKGDTEILERYSGRNFNILFELAHIDTRNRPEVSAADLSEAMTTGLRPDSMQGKAERQVITTMLTHIKERMPASPRYGAFDALFDALDVPLTNNGSYRRNTGITSLVNDLRMQAVYQGTASANLVKATEEIVLGSCKAERRELYYQFIGERLAPLIPKGDYDWIDPIVKAAAVAAESGYIASGLAETPEMRKLLFDDLLLSSRSDHQVLAASVSEAIATHKDGGSWFLDRLTLESFRKAPEKLENSHLANYSHDWRGNHRLLPKLLEIKVSPKLAEQIEGFSEGDFSVAADLGRFGTRNLEPAKADALGGLLSKGLDAGTYTHTTMSVPILGSVMGGGSEDIEFVTSVLEMINERLDGGYTESKALQVLRSLDKYSEAMTLPEDLLGKINDLRWRVELNKSPEANFDLAMDHVLADDRRTIYREIVKKDILPSLDGSHHCLHNFLDKIETSIRRRNEKGSLAAMKTVFDGGTASQKEYIAKYLEGVSQQSPELLRSGAFYDIFYASIREGLIGYSSMEALFKRDAGAFMGLIPSLEGQGIVQVGSSDRPENLILANFCGEDFGLLATLLQMDIKGANILSDTFMLRRAKDAFVRGGSDFSNESVRRLLKLIQAKLPQGWMGSLSAEGKKELKLLLQWVDEFTSNRRESQSLQAQIADIKRWL